MKGTPATQEAINATGLEHKVWLPGSASPSTFFLVHGRTGDSSVMWTFARAFQSQSPLTIAPQAPTPDPLGGYSWWPVETKVGSESARVALPASTYIAAVDLFQNFILKASSIYKFSPKNLNVVGFSQGAALVAGAALLNPSLFKSVTLLAGFIPELLFETDMLKEKIESGIATSRPTFFIGHGTMDGTVPIDRVRDGVNRLKLLGLRVEFIEEPVGHKVGSETIKALTNFYIDMKE